jgi:hypothetical protein
MKTKTGMTRLEKKEAAGARRALGKAAMTSEILTRRETSNKEKG